jgi:hypothetical protein
VRVQAELWRKEWVTPAALLTRDANYPIYEYAVPD